MMALFQKFSTSQILRFIPLQLTRSTSASPFIIRKMSNNSCSENHVLLKSNSGVLNASDNVCKFAAFHTSTYQNAGHNKWSNIRHGKARIDGMRASMIQKLSNKLPAAIKAGGGSIDPKLNRSVAKILQDLTANNVPKATIEKVLNNALQKVNKPPNLVEFDLKGPSGSFFVVKFETDNKRNTEKNLKKYIKSIGLGSFELANKGIRTYFEEKGVIEVPQVSASPENDSSGDSTASENPGKSLNLEEAENIAIEVGAEEVFESQSDDSVVYQFLCDPKDLNSIQSALSSLGYQVSGAEVELRPLAPVTLSQSGISLYKPPILETEN